MHFDFIFRVRRKRFEPEIQFADFSFPRQLTKRSFHRLFFQFIIILLNSYLSLWIWIRFIDIDTKFISTTLEPRRFLIIRMIWQFELTWDTTNNFPLTDSSFELNSPIARIFNTRISTDLSCNRAVATLSFPILAGNFHVFIRPSPRACGSVIGKTDRERGN